MTAQSVTLPSSAALLPLDLRSVEAAPAGLARLLDERHQRMASP